MPLLEYLKLFGPAVTTGIFLVWSRSRFDRALEAYRAEFASQLEERKQEFANAQRRLQKATQKNLATENQQFLNQQRELQAGLQREMAELTSRFSREVELLRATLSRDVEVRKLAAMRTVEALDAIVAQGEPLLRAVLDASNMLGRTQAVNEFLVLVRSKQHLVDEATYRRFHQYYVDLLKESEKTKNDPDAYARACQIQAEFIDLVRDAYRIPRTIAGL